MLINEKLEMIVWQPFKNYSTSLAKYLVDHRVFGRGNQFKFVQGPVPYLDNDLKEFDRAPSLGHTNWFPKVSTHYTKVLPIRNPYDRVISQWKHALKYDGGLSFDDFLFNNSKQIIQFPATKVYKYDKLIKVENIEQELKDLSLFNDKYNFPHENKSKESDNFQLEEKQKELIYYLHYNDFQTGGYDK
jgi:hypothetical protein